MNINEWALNQYKKAASEPANQKTEVNQSVLNTDNNKREINKPFFQKVNQEIGQILGHKKEKKDSGNSEKNQRKYFDPSETLESASKGAKENFENNLNLDNRKQALIKVPVTPPEEESIYRRVAKFLVVIGVDEAAKIMPHLTQEQTDKIIPEIASISYVSDEEAEQVIQEFQALMNKARESGGIDTARNILTKAYGSRKAEELINKSVAFPEGKPFDFLAEADADRIKLLLSGESPQVMALVLSQLEPKQAAGVINKMEADVKTQVMLRLAKMQPVAPEVIKEIAKTIEKKFQTQNTQTSQSLDGRGILAEILRRMDPLQESQLINTLAEGDPDLGADLRQRLFTEEDVLNSEGRFLQNKLQTMDTKEIAVLIKGKNENFRNKIFSNISRTRGDMVLEEESLLTNLTKSESERVTSEFYAALRRAWESGELRISNRDDGEVYV